MGVVIILAVLFGLWYLVRKYPPYLFPETEEITSNIITFPIYAKDTHGSNHEISVEAEVTKGNIEIKSMKMYGKTLSRRDMRELLDLYW